MKEYIGIPYVSKGRSFNGCDCYGLLCIIYKHEKGIVLEEFAETYIDAKNLASASDALLQNRRNWVKIDEAQVRQHDAVLLKVKGYAAHVGVVTDAERGDFIHTLAGHNSAIDNYKRLVWQKRIEGFYRLMA